MSASALRRRIAPSTPLTLELEDDSGGKFVKTFRLCFDFNAGAEILDRTGLSLLNGSIWQHIDKPTVFSVMFYAAILANHPEYRTVDEKGEPTDEGLEVIRSYMQEANAEPITEALWKAYLAFLPKEKRELMEKLRMKAEGKGSTSPLAAATPEATPESPISSSSGPLPDTTSGLVMKSSGA